MSQILDACGLTCPAPVLLVKDAIDRQEMAAMTVVVDNEPSCENVTRFLQSRGYAVTMTKKEDRYLLAASRENSDYEGAEEKAVAGEGEDAPQKIVVLIANDRLGGGDDELGKKLMVNYLKTIKEMGDDLWQLIFVNGGVRLTTGASPVLAELQEYERAGVIVLACGACLEHFGLIGDKAVGATTNMLDIVTATQLADKVVSLG